MSGSVNKVILIGNVGQDPDIRTTNQGVKIANFRVATSDQWKDKNTGERRERTEWHRIAVFGSLENDGLAGVVESYVKKGSKVYIEGKLQTRKWNDQQGVERYTTKVVLNGFGAKLELLDRKGGNGPPAPESPDDYGNTSSRPGKAEGQPAGDVDDDLPF